MPKPITPLLAADVIIELTDFPGRPIVLIERANPPYGWAIPGGFVDLGEIVEQAAVREAQEEVGLDVRLISLAWNLFRSSPRLPWAYGDSGLCSRGRGNASSSG